MMYLLRHPSLLLRLLLVCVLALGLGGLAAAAPGRSGEAVLEVANQDIATFRGSYDGTSPAARVDRALGRIQELDSQHMREPLALVPVQIGEKRGMAFRQGDQVLFVLAESDLEAGSGESLDQAAAVAKVRLEHALRALEEQRRRPVLLKGVGMALLHTVVLAALLWGLWRLVDVVLERLTVLRSAKSMASRNWARYGKALLSRLVQFMAVFLSAGLVFAWITSVLYAFPATRALSERLGEVFAESASTVGGGIIQAIPGLIVVVVILLLAQAVVEASNAMFRAIAHRQLRISAIHPETASATRRLASLGIWALAMVAIYPYLPGSNSDVFRGVSVLLGAMLTLGSSGVVNQLMSGLVLVYSRALRVGDYVVIGQDEGVVQEVGTLATKLVTMRNEEITIPNAVLVSSPIKNYSRKSEESGTLAATKVGVGYDTPWRQVHALLLDAASRTAGLRRTPAPFVLQRALSDFYVEYELLVYLDKPIERIPMLSALHGHIQDCFQEANVQMMSPHFMAQPEPPVVPPQGQWGAPKPPPAP